MRITSKGPVPHPQKIRELKDGPPSRGHLIAAHVKSHGHELRMTSREMVALLRDEPDEIAPR